MRSVVIWGYTNFKWLWIPLAKELKNRHRAKIHFVCTDAQSIEYWKKQDPDGVIDSFTTTGHFFSQYDRVEETEEKIYKQARQYEEKYQTLVVDVLQTDRHLGRGFFAGGIGHPKSKLSEKADYLKSVNFCNRAFAFWETLFNEKKPDLILGLAAQVLGKTCVAVARIRDIPMRELFRANYSAYHGWAYDEYYSLVGLKDQFEQMSDDESRTLVSGEELSTLKRLPFTDAYYRDFRKSVSWPSLVGKIVRQCRWYLYQWHKGRQTVGNYKFSEKIRALIRMRKDLKVLMRYPFIEPAELAKKSFILLPLHVEPESSVGMQSPEMNEQLACAEFIAKNLPVGTHLAVKEHLAAVGRRPRDFYETVADIPNVLMLSPYAYALDAARSARAVAVITSTLGMEAAVLGIPVISFGLHNNYNILPHVRTVESWTGLRPLLAEVCGEDTAGAKKKREEDGRRYLAAVKQCTIDLSWVDYASKDRPAATEKEVQVIYESLINSLRDQSSLRGASMASDVAISHGEEIATLPSVARDDV